MAINNPRRQEKKRTMNILKLKSGKQYRKWEKKQRRIKKGEGNGIIIRAKSKVQNNIKEN